MCDIYMRLKSYEAYFRPRKTCWWAGVEEDMKIFDLFQWVDSLQPTGQEKAEEKTGRVWDIVYLCALY